MHKSCFLLLSLSVAISLSQNCVPAEPCDPSVCQEPDCTCAASLPSTVAVEDMPQLVYLSFDDAMTVQADTAFYQGLFDGTYTNPNGCPIRATHYVSHQYNDYSLNHLYYSMGHEFASHSITHRYNTTYWKTMDPQHWADEVAGMKDLLGFHAGIPDYEITGVRAPFLQGGGDNQFPMMREHGFDYECSMPSRQYGFTNLANGIWPYSLEYANNLDCQIEPCPQCSYPDVWVQPILALEDMWLGAEGTPGVGVSCFMLDSCIIPDGNSPEQVKEMMMKNFLRAHDGNTRAPIGFYAHAAWFFTEPDWRYQGYKMFIEEITTNPLYNQDTWIVPVREGLRYRQNPVPLAVLQADQYEPFQCDSYPEYNCVAQSCVYYDVVTEDFTLNSIYMKVCGECPPNFPWLGDTRGLKPKI